ncbi:CapA family protein [bacterium]|nr:CapA family protein [bacterium]
MTKKLLLILFVAIILPGKFVASLKQPVQNEVSIIFGGDLMFDRYIRQIAQSKGYNYALEDLRDVLTNADVVIANLEGPITDNKSRSIYTEIGSRENYFFTFDPIITNTLKEFNINVVNIGNNHILNFGYNGLDQTVKNLELAQIQYFGDVSSKVTRSLVLNIDGTKVGLIGYNEFIDTNNNTLEEISKIKSGSDIVVVFAHWGPEYVKTAGKPIVDLAHQFVDSGADLVIGGHPHVVQQVEDYKGKRIYYSLGNFVMDQFFEPQVQEGMLVKVEIVDSEISGFEEISIFMDPKGKTTLQ